jgi:pre-mRNA-splicing factor CWC26
VVAGISEEALKKSGFRIPQEVPVHSWIKRGVGPGVNRYNIKPGRHWDGRGPAHQCARNVPVHTHLVLS